MASENFDLASFDELVSRIDKETADLKSQSMRARVIVVDECKEAVNRIDIAVETRIQELNALRRSYLAKIKIYEQECLRNLEEANMQEKLLSTVEKVEAFAKKWLHPPTTTPTAAAATWASQVDETIKQMAEKHLNQVELLNKNLKAILFGSQLLQYKSKDEIKMEDAIGCLEMKTLEIPIEIDESFKMTMKSSLTTSNFLKLLL
jgi:hypothetical protein